MKSIKTENQYSKANFYHSDGSGRDTYILHDSGGLTFKTQYVQVATKGKGLSYNPRSNSVYKPQSGNKIIHYMCNGSGRDNYVL